MTVKELIEKLKTMPEDMDVVCDDQEGNIWGAEHIMQYKDSDGQVVLISWTNRDEE